MLILSGAVTFIMSSRKRMKGTKLWMISKRSKDQKNPEDHKEGGQSWAK